MYFHGLEIAGIGVGMVFLALVVILGVTLGLRVTIDALEGRWRKRLTLTEPPAPTKAKEAHPATGSTAKAAAIAVALFMAEEAEGDFAE